MQITNLSKSIVLSVWVGFGGALLMGACTAASLPDEAACSTEEPEPPVEQPTTCAEPVKACPMYRIQLQGDPTGNAADRAKYKAAFGSACYVAAANNSFNCYFKTLELACNNGFLVPKIYGAAEYTGNYDCVPEGNGLYSRQIGPDPANKMYVYFENAPVETALIDVDGGAPIAINGPYRNLPQLTTVKAGEDFYCKTGIPGPDGGSLSQKEWILQVNRDANGGKIRSDLAGFTYPCKQGCPQICTEPEFLKDPESTPQISDTERAEVHHVVRRKDLRGCDWGTNANGNAVVISRKLNIRLRNYYPLANEVNWVNQIPPYTP